MTDKAKKQIAQEKSKKTGTLNLDNCGLVRIPKEVSTMNWLKELTVNDNQISKIEGLENLKQLEDLEVSNNQIQKIEGLEGLTELFRLIVSNNQISKIEGLQGLLDLTDLDLSA